MSKATSLYLDGQPSDWGNNICEGCSELTELYVNCMYPPKFDPNNTFPEDEWGWDDPVEMTLYVPVGAKDIPAATYKISSTAFGYCMSLTDFNVDPENMDYSDIDGVLFNKNKTKLLDYPLPNRVRHMRFPKEWFRSLPSRQVSA